jgi:TonB family protein
MAKRSSLVHTRFVPSPLWTAWAVSSSLALHAIAYFGLGARPFSLPPKPPKSVVAFEIAPEPAPPELPQKEPEPAKPEPMAPKAPVVEKRAALPEPATKPTAAPESAPAETVDMSGLTLTNDLGAGFAMPTGNGLAREGALRVPASLGRERPAPRDPERGLPEGPRLVGLGDLSSRPSPPALDGALQRNYPADARRRGLGGTASVRVRIDSDGVVRTVSMLNESSAGFGEACRRTVRGSRWSAPRDRAGQAVATEVRYTCRFVVTP